jgi:hypothetical protein
LVYVMIIVYIVPLTYGTRMIAFLKNDQWVTKLLASTGVVLLLIHVAQGLAVKAYWETHPEEYLKSVAERPRLEEALAKLEKEREAKRWDENHPQEVAMREAQRQQAAAEEARKFKAEMEVQRQQDELTRQQRAEKSRLDREEELRQREERALLERQAANRRAALEEQRLKEMPPEQRKAEEDLKRYGPQKSN